MELASNFGFSKYLSIVLPITIHNQFMFFQNNLIFKNIHEILEFVFRENMWCFCTIFREVSNLCIKCIKPHTKLLERDNEKLSTENNSRFPLMILLLILNGQVQVLQSFKFHMALNVGKYIEFYWSFPHQSILLNSKETTFSTCLHLSLVKFQTRENRKGWL